MAGGDAGRNPASKQAGSRLREHPPVYSSPQQSSVVPLQDSAPRLRSAVWQQYPSAPICTHSTLATPRPCHWLPQCRSHGSRLMCQSWAPSGDVERPSPPPSGSSSHKAANNATLRESIPLQSSMPNIAHGTKTFVCQKAGLTAATSTGSRTR
jgi:hypothetical protein